MVALVRTIAIAIVVALFCLSNDAVGDDGYGKLDFKWLNKEQENLFSERLQSLAMEEALLLRCGRSDTFAQRAEDAIRSCVTKDALDRARGVFDANVKVFTDYMNRNRQPCEHIPLVSRPSLGVHILTAPKGVVSKGAVVYSVAPTFPAARAGIRSGDVIVSINGGPVADIRELQEALAGLPVSKPVKIGVLRGGAHIVLSAPFLVFLPYSSDGRVVFDGPEAIKFDLNDMAKTLSQLAKLCQLCKYTVYRAYCN
ncbi:PDZ domain-containing protein [Mesorhizobium sp. 43Arga]